LLQHWLCYTQAFQDPNRAGMMRSQKVLEINPRHPVIRALKDRLSTAEEEGTEVSTSCLKIRLTT
jgi:HSP90 family molecular chaperone